ncbi:MAG: DUF302 domain-containing protein [Gammaproteobacteria bacterium]|nr:DUF302 domain-containing protein [Gammaproteobacteria bacterium]MBT8133960.1 DUF302 domain-containing protein [Gammaproteobacteria bacterium]NNJ50258.1 DUF302 domain-containing protein [Gammaproteobacteria bacterium]
MNTAKNISVQAVVISILLSTQVFADNSNGIIRIKSNHGVSTTIDKLETVLKEKGMTIFKRVNHTAGAEKAGLQLRPTELLIFGNPKVGTPLMLCSQTAALDLPQKALAYKDEAGQVWLAYNDPAYMAQRHNTKGCEGPVQKVSNALAKFTRAATE